MKRNLFIMLLAGAMLTASPFTALADDADLEARVTALEERVAALETQLAGDVPEGVSATPGQVAGEVPELATTDTGLVAGGCSLKYKRCELGKDYRDNDCVILYFDYLNESGETTSALWSFVIDVFQHDVEVEQTVIEDNEAFDNRGIDVRSGAATREVAFAYEISDTSDIIVELSSFKDFMADPIEFTVSLE